LQRKVARFPRRFAQEYRTFRLINFFIDGLLSKNPFINNNLFRKAIFALIVAFEQG
jgi:hypothetical protein